MPFLSLGLAPSLVRAASELGFITPSAIQLAAIPAVLRGADVLGIAQTGSGKTAAYALPVLQALPDATANGQRVAQALILVPTRELAAQVGDVLHRLALYLPRRVKIATVGGGVSINPQMMHLRGGADVVVATPGRLLDLLAHNALRLDQVRTLVLDEADRLLELGFADELQRVLACLPRQRQNLLFSATFPDAAGQLAQALLHEPVRLEMAPNLHSPAQIQQRAIQVDPAQRTRLLRQLIVQHQWSQVLVFVASKYAATHVAEKLYRNGIFAVPFHGDLSQGARSQVLADFKDARWDVLVTTDLAARGIDIAQLAVVLNYDLPRSAVDYVHRIGRTGRYGATGEAISFVSAASEAHFRLIEKRQGLSVQREQIPGFEPKESAAPMALGTGGIKGKRPSKKDKLRMATARATAA